MGKDVYIGIGVLVLGFMALTYRPQKEPDVIIDNNPTSQLEQTVSISSITPDETIKDNQETSDFDESERLRLQDLYFSENEGEYDNVERLVIDDFDVPSREELSVELVKVVQETAPFTVDLSVRSGRRIRMIELLIVPAIWRYQIDQVSPMFQILPIFVQIRRVGIVPVDADDCGWLELIVSRCR